MIDAINAGDRLYVGGARVVVDKIDGDEGTSTTPRADGSWSRSSHFPDRKKPIIRLGKNGSYVAHAVFKDEESAESFTEFFMELWCNE